MEREQRLGLERIMFFVFAQVDAEEEEVFSKERNEQKE